jgi:hypothetical protein|tara:strand:- start:17 stop:208 length:192 start_codon:yes stop_codon:yes gene_type:complete
MASLEERRRVYRLMKKKELTDRSKIFVTNTHSAVAHITNPVEIKYIEKPPAKKEKKCTNTKQK